MLAPAARHKRARSPSPKPDDNSELTSPLDVLIKRRRRSEQPYAHDSRAGPSNHAGPSRYHHTAAEGYDHDLEDGDVVLHGDASPYPKPGPGVDRRRARQWERLNAPPLSLPHSSSSSSHAHAPHSIPPRPPEHGESNHPSTSQPNMINHIHLSPDPSPIPRWYSQPDPPLRSLHSQMSSSPVRHQPPTSSPFRDSSQTKAEEWDPEELGTEWGEYAAQNSLLYNLHRARTTPSATPDTTLLQTPHPVVRPSPHGLHGLQANDASNPHFAPTPYRQQHPPPSSSTHLPSSSPFPAFQPSSDGHLYPYNHPEGDEDEAMEVLADAEDEAEHDGVTGLPGQDVKRRYEEANRLLAELNVVRRQRWGDSEV
ncbi:hypothetical protein JCM24511_08437 [Saitozyma sp. JCM 24511]|nr:hypothetical protein JCM24511_08437 [Saitozyma sp. JCM 24511]